MQVVDPIDGQVYEREALLADAGLLGFELVNRVTDTGQEVWEWQRADEPRPQFVSERVALHWMHDWLDRHGDTAQR